MKRLVPIGLALAFLACGPQAPELTPTEQAAKDRSECLVEAIDQTGFDPVTAEAPSRTVTSSRKSDAKVMDGSEIVKDGAKGAVGGVVAGAIMGDAGKGAVAGAAVGTLFGGVKRHKESKQTVKTVHNNPEYEAYVQKKEAYKQALDACISKRVAGRAT